MLMISREMNESNIADYYQEALSYADDETINLTKIVAVQIWAKELSCGAGSEYLRLLPANQRAELVLSAFDLTRYSGHP